MKKGSYVILFWYKLKFMVYLQTFRRDLEKSVIINLHHLVFCLTSKVSKVIVCAKTVYYLKDVVSSLYFTYSTVIVVLLKYRFNLYIYILILTVWLTISYYYEIKIWWYCEKIQWKNNGRSKSLEVYGWSIFRFHVRPN